jgi:hypothetical protein
MAQNEIRVLSDLSLVGSINFSTNFADFPANPSPRTMVVVKGVTYLYTELLYNSGYFSWQPIGLKQTSHLHTQGVPSTVWTVTHNFNSTDFAYFVYDSNHNMMFANIKIVDSNTVKILLSEATSGTAVFFSIEYVNAQAINAASSVGIGSITLRDANGILTANNNPVAMAQAVSDAFATVYTKPQTDSAISAAVATEAAARVLGDADTLAAANSFTIEQLMNVVGDITVNATTAATSSTEYTDSKVAQEAARAEAAESALGSRIDSVISNTDSVALNSLAEVVTAFQSADGNMAAAIAALGTNATSALATEVSRAETAESLLTGNLSAEVAARIAADATNTNAIAAEASARASAITAEATVRSTAITAEVNRATAAESVLTTNLTSEVSARISGDTASVATAKGYTDNAVANEVTARNSVVDAEIVRATAAELVLTTNLASEVTNRTAADAVTLASAKSYTDSSVATEVARASAAEVVLTGKVTSTAAATLASANTYTDGAISTEVTARNVAIANASQSGSAKLTTARTINGVSFDGSANISFGTDSVVEGTSNKYYTDARARTAISVTGSGSYNSTTGVITVTGGVTSVSGKTGAVVLATADVTESTNLYFTTARASAAAPVQSVFGRSGAVVLSSSDVTTALGCTPVSVATAVTSVAGRSGAVVLEVADVSGAAPQATTYTKTEVDAAIAAAITAFAATLYV